MSSVGAAIFGRAIKSTTAAQAPAPSNSPAVKLQLTVQGEKRSRAVAEAATKTSDSMRDESEDSEESEAESSSDEGENVKKKPCLKKDNNSRASSSSPKNPHYLVSQIGAINGDNLLSQTPVKMRAAINQVLCDYIGSPECKDQFMRALTAANGNYDAMNPNWWQPTKLSTVVALLGKMFAKGAAVADTEKPYSSK